MDTWVTGRGGGGGAKSGRKICFYELSLINQHMHRGVAIADCTNADNMSTTQISIVGCSHRYFK